MKTVEVSGCYDCPLHRYSHNSKYFCGLSTAPSFGAVNRPAPDSCPLRAGEVTFRIKQPAAKVKAMSRDTAVEILEGLLEDAETIAKDSHLEAQRSLVYLTSSELRKRVEKTAMTIALQTAAEYDERAAALRMAIEAIRGR